MQATDCVCWMTGEVITGCHSRTSVSLASDQYVLTWPGWHNSSECCHTSRVRKNVNTLLAHEFYYATKKR